MTLTGFLLGGWTVTADAVTDAVLWTVETFGPLLVGGDRVEVELVKVAEGSPMAGAVGWDQGAGCWRVLAADQVKGRRLLFLVLHELAHVVNGDQVKGAGWSTLAVDRAIMTGAARASGLAAVRQGVLSRSASRSDGSQAESKADSWAERQTGRWWPMVEKLARLAELTEHRG